MKEKIFYTATRKSINATVVEGAALFPGRVTARRTQAPTTLNLPLNMGASTAPPYSWHAPEPPGCEINKPFLFENVCSSFFSVVVIDPSSQKPLGEEKGLSGPSLREVRTSTKDRKTGTQEQEPWGNAACWLTPNPLFH